MQSRYESINMQVLLWNGLSSYLEAPLYWDRTFSFMTILCFTFLVNTTCTSVVSSSKKKKHTCVLGEKLALTVSTFAPVSACCQDVMLRRWERLLPECWKALSRLSPGHLNLLWSSISFSLSISPPPSFSCLSIIRLSVTQRRPQLVGSCNERAWCQGWGYLHWNLRHVSSLTSAGIR